MSESLGGMPRCQPTFIMKLAPWCIIICVVLTSILDTTFEVSRFHNRLDLNMRCDQKVEQRFSYCNPKERWNIKYCHISVSKFEGLFESNHWWFQNRSNCAVCWWRYVDDYVVWCLFLVVCKHAGREISLGLHIFLWGYTQFWTMRINNQENFVKFLKQYMFWIFRILELEPIVCYLLNTCYLQSQL